MEHPGRYFTYLDCNVFENLVDCLGSLVEGPLCLVNLGSVVLQVFVCLGEVLLVFFDPGFGALNFCPDPLFCLLVANQCFALNPDDLVKIG